MVKVILDTDIGANIDDAFALALAACSPEIDLLGVTTIERRSWESSLIAKKLLELSGRSDVPVASVEPSRSDPRGLRPVPLIRSLLKENDHVTLVSTGALTTYASLLRNHPDIVPNVDRIVFMGGWPTQSLPESNILADPEAMETLLSSNVPLVSVDYDVTLPCVLRSIHLLKLQSEDQGVAPYLLQLYKEWHKKHGRAAIMHDPLTIAIMLDPSLVELEEESLVLSPDGILRRDEPGQKVSTGVSVDVERYLELLIHRVTGSPVPTLATFANPAEWMPRVRGAYMAQHYKNWTLQEHESRHHSLFIVRSGSCQVKLREQRREYVVTENAAFYLAPDDVRSIVSESGMQAMWFHFDIVSSPASTQTTFRRIPGLTSYIPATAGAESSYLHNQAEKISRYWMHPGTAESLLCSSAFLELLAFLIDRSIDDHVATAGSQLYAALLNAKDYIEQHFTEDITLEEIGKHVGVSQYHLARLFREAFGRSPIDYRLHLRMERAKQLLRLGQVAVADVASQVGYGSVSAFSRAFHKRFGVSPREYQQQKHYDVQPLCDR